MVLRRLFLYTSAWLGFFFFFLQVCGHFVAMKMNYCVAFRILSCRKAAGCLNIFLLWPPGPCPGGFHRTARCPSECTLQSNASLSPALPAELSPIFAKAAAASSGRRIRIRFSWQLTHLFLRGALSSGKTRPGICCPSTPGTQPRAWHRAEAQSSWLRGSPLSYRPRAFEVI